MCIIADNNRATIAMIGGEFAAIHPSRSDFETNSR